MNNVAIIRADGFSIKRTDVCFLEVISQASDITYKLGLTMVITYPQEGVMIIKLRERREEDE